MEIEDFNTWREMYDDLIYADQLNFYNRIADEHPIQNGFNLQLFYDFFSEVSGELETVNVLEFGGWKGELAQEILPRFPKIRCWINYEISETAAIVQAICHHSKYFPYIPGDFIWNLELPNVEVFVSSHTIEHIRFSNLAQLFNRLPESMQFIGLQAPLVASAEDYDWTGYHGSHILEVGWEQVEMMLIERGFRLMKAESDFRSFQKMQVGK